jgi:glycosyltransferase involved in cell wall biosynthesis
MPAGPLRVLLISALTAVKRADISLAVARMVLDRVPGAHVTAFDRGAEGRLYRARDSRIEFRLPVRHDEMPNLIAQHHVVVGQFGIGSLGMSELEAMACGRPVTCHFTMGSTYAEPPPLEATQDASRASAWIAELAADRRKLEAAGSAARHWVVEYHSASAVASKVDKLYAELAGAGRGRARS